MVLLHAVREGDQQTQGYTLSYCIVFVMMSLQRVSFFCPELRGKFLKVSVHQFLGRGLHLGQLVLRDLTQANVDFSIVLKGKVEKFTREEAGETLVLLFINMPADDAYVVG